MPVAAVLLQSVSVNRGDRPPVELVLRFCNEIEDFGRAAIKMSVMP